MVASQWLTYLAQAWAAVGAVIACAFLLIAIDRTDPGARRAYAFRPLLIPGIVLLWPLVLVRWLAREKGTF